MREQLTKLREQMKSEGIDVYYIPMDDFHQSEYVGDYFRSIAYVTGFTGSAANVAVTQTEAKLFTDGRYFVQAAAQLTGSGVDLMKMGEPNVPSLDEYLAAAVPEGGCLGFDGRCVDYKHGMALKALTEKKHATIKCADDLVDRIWTDRPALACSKVWVLAEKWAGKSAADKLRELRAQMERLGADIHVISSLDDIAWLLNLRGDDIPCNPVFLSYLLVDMQGAYLFANPADFDEETTAYLKGLGVTLADYNGIYHAAAQLRDRSILLESAKTNYAIISALDASVKVVDAMLPTSSAKAIKNETEQENMRRAHIKDGVAMTQFYYFIKHAFGADGTLTEAAKEALGADRLTELTAENYLERLRRAQDGNLGLSFHTISAYGAHAAMCHYSATPESDAEIKPEGMYLVDSGGQYYEGTTDITRTFIMGPITDEMRLHFTLVAQSMLRLADVQFLYGSSGMTLDYVARGPFWKRGLNFNHGTGHGVGYLLNVHERPNGIRYRFVPERMDSAVLEEGHVTSDEPGLYIEGSHGIRTENLTLCRKAFTNEYGTFMHFEHLTMCPIDLDGIDVSVMTADDVALLNAYHKKVYETLAPYFDGEMKAWLAQVTRAV